MLKPDRVPVNNQRQLDVFSRVVFSVLADRQTAGSTLSLRLFFFQVFLSVRTGQHMVDRRPPCRTRSPGMRARMPIALASLNLPSSYHVCCSSWKYSFDMVCRLWHRDAPHSLVLFRQRVLLYPLLPSLPFL